MLDCTVILYNLSEDELQRKVVYYIPMVLSGGSTHRRQLTGNDKERRGGNPGESAISEVWVEDTVDDDRSAYYAWKNMEDCPTVVRLIYYKTDNGKYEVEVCKKVKVVALDQHKLTSRKFKISATDSCGKSAGKTVISSLGIPRLFSWAWRERELLCIEDGVRCNSVSLSVKGDRGHWREGNGLDNRGASIRLECSGKRDVKVFDKELRSPLGVILWEDKEKLDSGPDVENQQMLDEGESSTAYQPIIVPSPCREEQQSGLSPADKTPESAEGTPLHVVVVPPTSSHAEHESGRSPVATPGNEEQHERQSLLPTAPSSPVDKETGLKASILSRLQSLERLVPDNKKPQVPTESNGSGAVSTLWRRAHSAM
eukprot:TRINITY_DN6674_c0_g1_i1.p1 TRINITY_DN6674_c0_g1~~TRINITY_DN6674_c0_g1_i1.p1  ORF type:complete len:370 (-),score=67.56 TRINITY_DN6674_c0_g1_i1:224-1333(-)